MYFSEKIEQKSIKYIIYNIKVECIFIMFLKLALSKYIIDRWTMLYFSDCRERKTVGRCTEPALRNGIIAGKLR